MELFGKVKAFAGDAADSTSRAAQRAKLEADIKLLDRNIRICKEAFGVAIWDIFRNDKAKVNELHIEHEQIVEGFLADIASKRLEIEKLKLPALDRDLVSDSVPARDVPSVSAPVPSAPSVAPKGGYPSRQASPPVAASAEPSNNSGGFAGLVGAAVTASAVASLMSSASQSRGANTADSGQQNATGPRGGAATDAGSLAGVFTAVAGAAASTGTTEKVASAAAPHVAAAAQQRYTSEGGIEKLTQDAQTVASVGKAVADNPAARALGTALLSGLVAHASDSAAAKRT